LAWWSAIIGELILGVACGLYAGIVYRVAVRRPQLFPSFFGANGIVAFMLSLCLACFADVLAFPEPTGFLWHSSRVLAGVAGVLMLAKLRTLPDRLSKYRSSQEWHDLVNAAYTATLRASILEEFEAKPVRLMDVNLARLNAVAANLRMEMARSGGARRTSELLDRLSHIGEEIASVKEEISQQAAHP